jgi:bla regulator protein BlaR1
MPALFVFLFKVNIALLLFCAGYYLVLRHLTFYTLNRAYYWLPYCLLRFTPKLT